MGLLDRTKSPAVLSTSSSSLLPSGYAATAAATSNSASIANCTKQATITTNLKISGNKKASYSFCNENCNNNSEVRIKKILYSWD